MDHIRQAIERAKETRGSDLQPQEQPAAGPLAPQSLTALSTPAATQAQRKEIVLSGPHLESKRIIAHDITDPRTKSFDVLRTQVLQSMDLKSWQFLGVTSATEDCGKTVVATNLALSISRQTERSVLLIDMDLQRPHVADCLGLSCDQDVVSVLEGQANLSNVIIQASIRNQNFLVLPCKSSTLNSSEWMASRSMSALLQAIKRDYRAWTVIIDLPPMLVGDDVISILPQIDGILLVAAIGTTTLAQIKECNKHFESTSVVRVVINKTPDMAATYSYSRYGRSQAS